MILVGVILAVVVALLRGGKLERISELDLKALPLVWVALALRFTVGPLAAHGFIFASLLQVVAYMVFLYVVFLNLSLPGIKLFGAGTAANFLVIALNGGRMPVSPEALVRAGAFVEPVGTHCLLTDQSRLWFLADIIYFPFFYRSIVSVGDLLIVAGIFLYIQYRMTTPEDARKVVFKGK